MENKIFDNGCCLLGRVDKIISYLEENMSTSDMEETVIDMINDLKTYYASDSIVVVNYDNPMSYCFEEFKSNDVIKDQF